jgi:hypothetical protein
VFQKIYTVYKSEESVPCQPSGRLCHPVRTPIYPLFHPSRRRAIPSGCPTNQAPLVWTTCISVRTLHYIEKLLFHLASVRTTQQPVRPPFSIRSSFRFFPKYIWEDCYNRPDDVDFHPDALLLKVRITIQIQSSGRLSAWSGRAFNTYGNCRFDFNRLNACLLWSRCVHNKYENCGLKINGPDGHPPWSGRAKPYMEITCSGRATVRTTVSHRPDAPLKQERFSTKISEILVAQLFVRTTPIYFTAVTHLNLSLYIEAPGH